MFILIHFFIFLVDIPLATSVRSLNGSDLTLDSTEPDTNTVRRRRRKHKIRSDQLTDSTSSPSQSSTSLQQTGTGEEINIDDTTQEMQEAAWKIKAKDYFDSIRNGIRGFSYAVVNFLNETSVDYRQIASQLYSERRDRAKVALELPPVPRDNSMPELSRETSTHFTTKVFISIFNLFS